MSRPSSPKSDWLTLLAGAISQEPDEIPDGFKTIPQLAIELGAGETTLRQKFSILERQGKVERKLFKVQTKRGVQKSPHWRIL